MTHDFDPTLFNASQAQADADRLETWAVEEPRTVCDDCHQPVDPADLILYTETPPTWTSPREEARLCADCLNARIQRTWPTGRRWSRR